MAQGHFDMRKLSFALILLAANAAASAAAPAHKCKYSRVAELPAWAQNGRPATEGSVNGRKIGILLDTGAATSLINRSAVQKLGLTRFDAAGVRIVGAGGETAARAVQIDEFKLGNAVRNDWRVLVSGEGALGSDIAVVLGYDFFQDLDVEFDLPGGAVRFFQAEDCDNVALSYWTKEPAGQVAIEPAAQLELTVQVNGRPVRAQLDTGASTSVLESTLASQLGVTAQSPGVVRGGCSSGLGRKPIESWVGQFESFAIGHELIHNPGLRFAEMWKDMSHATGGAKNTESLPAMLLGADFLRAHRVLIAHSQRKIYFTYAGGTVFPVELATACGPRS
jgi:clan AA aspartic protease (TIGR02281 family)